MPGSTQPDNKSINWLLAGLPKEEYARLLPHLEAVALEVGKRSCINSFSLRVADWLSPSFPPEPINAPA